MMLAGFAKACTQEKYQYFISKNLTVYYFLAGLNVFMFTTIIGIASYGFKSEYGIL
jgi:hypothetical protein